MKAKFCILLFMSLLLLSCETIETPDVIGPPPISDIPTVPPSGEVDVNPTDTPHPTPSLSPTTEKQIIKVSATQTPTNVPTVIPTSTQPIATTTSTATSIYIATATPTAMTYMIKAGDTLSVIARAHGVTVEALAEANNISDPSLIRVGQILIIPVVAAEATPTIAPTAIPSPTSTSKPTITASPTAKPSPTLKPTATPVPTKPPPSDSCLYIGNKNTKVFHYASCSSVKRMSEANKICFSTREQAIAQGYKPCKRCNP